MAARFRTRKAGARACVTPRKYARSCGNIKPYRLCRRVVARVAAAAALPRDLLEDADADGCAGRREEDFVAGCGLGFVFVLGFSFAKGSAAGVVDEGED